MSNLLQGFRKEIDAVDREITRLLAERFRITQKVGVYKAKHQLPPLDKQREEEVLANKKLLAAKYKISPLLIEKIFKLVMAEARKNHRYEKTRNT